MLVRCSRSYRKDKGEKISTRLEAVRKGVIGNATTFPKPPSDDAAIAKMEADLLTNTVAYRRGGIAQKPAYVNTLDASIKMLNGLADYVDNIANGDENIVLMSGFIPTDNKKNKPTNKPNQPTDVKVTRGTVGVIEAECATVDKAVYGCILTDAPLSKGVVINALGQLSVPKDAFSGNILVDLNKSRKKYFQGLIPKTTYYVYFYIVNTKGVSVLSDEVSIICA